MSVNIVSTSTEYEDNAYEDIDEEFFDNEEEDEMPTYHEVPDVEAGMEKLRQLTRDFKNSGGVPHGVLMQEEDRLRIHWKPARPCYGELRRYGPTSTRPQDYKPGDLGSPLGKGVPLAVSMPIVRSDTGWSPQGGQYEYTDANKKDFGDLIERMYLNTETSPYKACLQGRELIYDEKGLLNGFIVPHTDFDSTLLVALGISIRSWGGVNLEKLKFMTDLGDLHPAVLNMMAHSFSSAVDYKTRPYTYTWVFKPGTLDGSYYLNPKLDLKAFINGTPWNLSGGTFRDGFDYNRPHLPFLFSLDTEKNPKTLAGTSTRDAMNTEQYKTQTDWPSMLTAVLTKLGVTHDAKQVIEHAKEIENEILNWG